MSDVNLPKECLRLLKPRLPQMLATLHRFVSVESPSLEKAAADRCCRVIAKNGIGTARAWNESRRSIVEIFFASLKRRTNLALRANF